MIGVNGDVDYTVVDSILCVVVAIDVVCAGLLGGHEAELIEGHVLVVLGQ